jgi:hypothetical protein
VYFWCWNKAIIFEIKTGLIQRTRSTVNISRDKGLHKGIVGDKWRILPLPKKAVITSDRNNPQRMTQPSENKVPRVKKPVLKPAMK